MGSRIVDPEEVETIVTKLWGRDWCWTTRRSDKSVTRGVDRGKDKSLKNLPPSEGIWEDESGGVEEG